MRTKIYLMTALALAGLAVTFNACQKKMAEPVGKETAEAVNYQNPIELDWNLIRTCGDKQVSPLSDKKADYGTITIRNNDDFLFITVKANEGYLLKYLATWMGAVNDFPLNPGGKPNPAPGEFPYQNLLSPSVTEYTQVFAKADIAEFWEPGSFALAVKADLEKLNSLDEVIGTVGGWGKDIAHPFPGPQWGWTLEYAIQSCPTECFGPDLFATAGDSLFAASGWNGKPTGAGADSLPPRYFKVPGNDPEGYFRNLILIDNPATVIGQIYFGKKISRTPTDKLRDSISVMLNTDWYLYTVDQSAINIWSSDGNIKAPNSQGKNAQFPSKMSDWQYFNYHGIVPNVVTYDSKIAEYAIKVHVHKKIDCSSN